MLHRLYVKNLALIEEEEILFERGLNILTGETGAGKSVLLGAVLLALGVKADKNLIRSGAEYALIELTFTADTQEQEKILSDMDLQPDEDGQILVKRRIYPGRNICYACGESVTLRQLKTISDLLLEVHGQRENGALLESVRQREALDIYMGDPGKKLLKRMQECCSQLRELQSAWETDDLDESQRRREEEAKAGASRLSLRGSGDRSERIRTYNFPQNRLTDHRVDLTLYSLDRIVEGDLDPVLSALHEKDLTDRISTALGKAS